MISAIFKRIKATCWPVLTRRLPWNLRVSYAQFGEDMIVDWLTRGQNEGFFVDVGGYHPIALSNTYSLYCRGWRGICVEPRREILSEFDRYRAGDINVAACIVPSPQEHVTLFVFDDPALTTVDAERMKELVRGGQRVVATRRVPALTLRQLIEQYGEGRTEIDVLNIDVEGIDTEILRAHDWAYVRPRILLVEQHGLRTLAEAVSCDTTRFTAAYGYKLVAKCGPTLIFAQDPPK